VKLRITSLAKLIKFDELSQGAHANMNPYDELDQGKRASVKDTENFGYNVT
jgi:hypothetical protein